MWRVLLQRIIQKLSLNNQLSKINKDIMTTIKNTIIKSSVILTLVIGLSISAKAQYGPGGPGSGAPGATGVPQDYGGANNQPGVPFDGGLSLILIAAGAGVSAKRKRLNA